MEPRSRIANFRNSVTSRMSSLFERRQHGESSNNASHRTSGACEVPIFMSPSSERVDNDHDDPEATATYSPPMRQGHGREYARTVPASSIYSQSPDPRTQNTFMDRIEEESHPRSPNMAHDLEAGASAISCASSEEHLIRERRRRRRRVSESNRQKIASKKRLGVAFGVTTLAAVITCKYPCGT